MPALSRDRILAAAVELADRDGFSAVTLRKVASELGVHVTSLYRHVPDFDAVLDGMVERLIAEAELPVHGLAWEGWVRRFFAAMMSTALKHPGAFEAFQHRPVQGPVAAATFEAALTAFTKAGLPLQDAYGALKVTSFVTISAAGERAAATIGELTSTEIERLPLDAFPHVRGLESVDDLEPAWDFGLETLVAGLKAQVRKAKAG